MPLHAGKLIRYIPCAIPEATASPLVVLLPWLGAKSEHIAKYCKLYHDRRFSVVTVAVGARHFVWPSNALPLVHDLVEYLRSQQLRSRRLVFHSFSVGSYVYSVMLHEMLKAPQEYADIAERVGGQIFDSITVGGTDRMARGIATALTSNTALQGGIVASMAAYFSLTRPWTTKFYDEVIQAFYDNPIKSAPMLYFYSLNDPMCDPEHMLGLVRHQTKAGHAVRTKVWGTSRHASHLAIHTQEYLSSIDSFLTTACAMLQPSSKL